MVKFHYFRIQQNVNYKFNTTFFQICLLIRNRLTHAKTEKQKDKRSAFICEHTFEN